MRFDYRTYNKNAVKLSPIKQKRRSLDPIHERKRKRKQKERTKEHKKETTELAQESDKEDAFTVFLIYAQKPKYRSNYFL